MTTKKHKAYELLRVSELEIGKLYMADYLKSGVEEWPVFQTFREPYKESGKLVTRTECFVFLGSFPDVSTTRTIWQQTDKLGEYWRAIMYILTPTALGYIGVDPNSALFYKAY